MLSFFRYIKGYVIVFLNGFSPERFINLCNNHHMKIWNVTPCADGYQFCMAVSDVYRTKDFLKKTNTKVVIRKKLGLPFLLYRYRKRKIFVLCLFSCFITLFLATQFIWSFGLSGNRMLTEDLYMEFLKAHNISYGCKINTIDTAYLEKEIREQYDYITWASFQINGTSLCLTINENQNMVDENEKNSQNGNICAVADGVISGMVTRNGTPVVQKGDTVQKGEVLILGEIPIYNDDETIRENHYTHADGDITIEYTMEYKDTQPYDVNKKLYTGRSALILILGCKERQIKLPFPHNFEKMDRIQTLNFVFPDFHEKIPLYFGTEECKEYTYTEEYLNREDALGLLNDRFHEFCKTLNQKGIQIIRKDVKINYGTNQADVLVDLTVQISGGLFVPISE